MATVVMEGWREGMEKVSLTKLQVELLNISLKEAKNNVDFLLENNELSLEIDNNELAREFFKRAEKIGVNCSLILT